MFSILSSSYLRHIRPSFPAAIRCLSSLGLIPEPSADKNGPSFPISRVHIPSLDSFRRDYFETSEPVILTGAIGDWPALTRWRNLADLKDRYGDVVVPIELGTTYSSPDFEQVHMTLAQYIDLYLIPTKSPDSDNFKLPPKAYLAQYQLFDSIPDLKHDFQTLPYTRAGRGDLYQTVAWLGPAHTVTPPHRDPYYGLLAQIFGEKYFRLYLPRDEQYLYPHEDRFRRNTSRVNNIREYDQREFPWFGRVGYLDGVLREGEVLFLPLGWWHYVESLSVSFSISSWFR